MNDRNEPRYELLESGEFVITNYNQAKSFASFFPGVAGLSGIPLWLFYVNRAQCVCSMGVQDKEHPIMEFLPANWAYNLVSSQGFRTFLKISHHPEVTFYEPFQDFLRDREIRRTQRMTIGSAHLNLEEENETLGLRFSVDYFSVPEDIYAGLVRVLRIENRTQETVQLEALDGLPLIIPYGVDNQSLKMTRRLVEAFVEVANCDRLVPFFRGKVEPADRPDVVRIEKGNFYLGFTAEEAGATLVRPIVDPVRVFGTRGDYSFPERFLTRSARELGRVQILENRLPCALGGIEVSIAPGDTCTYTSIIGHAPSPEALNRLLPTIANPAYVARKAQRNGDIVAALTQNQFICSSARSLDHYARQNYLDNTLRGGFPLTLTGREGRTTFHVYSRKHGDLERDYNQFLLTPTPYSQGNGNYRDINQNRRCDVFFNPAVAEGSVEHFFNLIQLDGFNPLVIKESQFFAAQTADLDGVLERHLGPEDAEAVRELTRERFTPGELLLALEKRGIELEEQGRPFLGDLLAVCQRTEATDYGEGYWTDHWTYNLDLLESYLAVYPEQRRSILFEKKTFTFYDNPHRVRPRDEKYVVWDGRPMQLGAVVFDEDKEARIRAREHSPNAVRTAHGQGDVYRTSLFIKLLCLITNKVSSLDPHGVGVEMEADKPNWYDALNGLPGLMGSSSSETLEIQRHILFLSDALEQCGADREEWAVFTELKEFMEALYSLLEGELDPYQYWDRATSARELYREKTRLGVIGTQEKVTGGWIRAFLQAALQKVERGLEKAWDGQNGLVYTYFVNTPTEFEPITAPSADGKTAPKRNAKGLPCFRAMGFQQTPLPLFLEGPVHYLRCRPGREKAQECAANVRKSALYDTKLNMFKVNAPLADQPMEIGRARVFSPGWFENESVWMHMEYKYLLELLRNELYEEFYGSFVTACVPFFKPEVYGRSILENSSFIVSSANPDPSLHGNGFVARLSGATAEFIQMLLFMSVGQKPFSVDAQGTLELRFAPTLAGWLFTEEPRTARLQRDGDWQEVEFPENSFTFRFLGEVLVTYHNPTRKDTYGADGVAPVSMVLADAQGKSTRYDGTVLRGDVAEQVRGRQVRKIDIELA